MEDDNNKPNPLWDPRKILKPLQWVVATITFLATVGALTFTHADLVSLVGKIMPNGRPLNAVTAPLIILLAITTTFLLVYFQLCKERIERRKEWDKSANLRLLLDNVERERLLDLSTGIPKEEKLEKGDFEEVKRQTPTNNLASLPAQLILINIDNFGSINNRYGHQTGTDVIRMIAQSIS